MIRFATPSEPESVPDPRDDCDALEELEDEIVVLAAQIHAATQRLLTLIADFDRRRGWELGGYRSCAHWLHARTGIDLGAAREKVRTARALVGLPRINASMSRGELSFSAVRALTRVATGENEGDLLDFARGCTTAQVERLVRGYRRGDGQDELDIERERYRRRTLSVFPGDDGMYVLKGRLMPEVGALLMRAVEAAGDALFKEEQGPVPEAERERAAAQRRADALGLLAERALAAGFGGRDAEEAPISGSRAERYQVVLHVETETLASAEASSPPARLDSIGRSSHLEDGTRVSAETSRRLSCDAGVVPMKHAPDGSILDVGRRTRTIPPAIRRALETRDRGCRFPGCGLRFSEGHHIVHWANGGKTRLDNLVLLCHHHHRLVHEEGWKVDWWGEGKPVFLDPRGGVHYEGRWQWPRGVPQGNEALVNALLADNRRQGAEPDWWTPGAKWESAADVPESVYYRAVDALLLDSG